MKGTLKNTNTLKYIKKRKETKIEKKHPNK